MNLTSLHLDTIEQVNSYVDGPEDFGKGRVCATCGCFLCRYNSGDHCWSHNVVEFEDERPMLRVLEGGKARERVAA
jgi:hypothetical protein